MSYIENIPQYLALLKAFCASYISATDFEKDFSLLWEKDRDESVAKMKSLFGDYDIELQQSAFDGRISDEEFSQEWRRIYGLTNEISMICGVIDRVYTACDCFWENIPEEDVNLPLVINDRMLREEVLCLLDELVQAVDRYRYLIPSDSFNLLDEH